MRSASLLVCMVLVVAAGCAQSESNDLEGAGDQARVLTSEVPADWVEVRDFEPSHGFVFSVPATMNDATEPMAQFSEENYGTTVLIAFSTPGWTTVFSVIDALAMDADQLDELVAGFDTDPEALSSELDMTLVAVETVNVDGKKGLLLHADDSETVGAVLAVRRSDGKALGFTIVSDSPSSLSTHVTGILGSLRWTAS